MKTLLLALLFFSASPARAEDAEEQEPQVTPVAENAPSIGQGGAQGTWEDDLAAEMGDRILHDPKAAEAVASRILRSKIAPTITRSTASSEGEFKKVLGWVRENPLDAGHLAVGFAQDDEEGNQAFEYSLFNRIQRRFELSPDRYKGLYGKLHGIADLSKTLAARPTMNEEQSRSMLKRFFEGRANEAHARFYGEGDSMPPDPGAGAAPGRPPVSAARALYDRLSATNPTGFSPQVMALQSQLNQTRPPGAPKLMENGKLGYDTLSYPRYALRYDIGRLDTVLKAQEDYQRAHPRKAPDAQAKGAEDEEASFPRRRQSISAAEEALGRFDAEAAKTKDPKQINAPTLRNLSAHRRETARWINIAALQERLHKLEAYRAFMNPALLSAIGRVPVDDETRRLYRERGSRLQAALEAAIEDTRKTLALLRDGSDAALAEADRFNRASIEAGRRLPAEIEQYAEAPWRLLDAYRPVSRLRAWIERLVVAFLPNTDLAKRIKRRVDEERIRRDEFSRIAALT